MPASLEPIKAFKCTFTGCAASFDTEKKLIGHKKDSDEHDYCSKCNLDFESYEDLARHKAFTPDKHGKACRLCGEEFKSRSGLERHTELAHKVKQKLPCIGCGEIFPTPALLIEHLEFGHCDVISGQSFMGHVVHCHLVAKLLAGGEAHNRFMQKISQYDASLDHEDEGGVGIENVLEHEDEDAKAVNHPAIQPDSVQDDVPHTEPWPALSAQGKDATRSSTITSRMGRMSLGGSDADTVVSSGSHTMQDSAAPNQSSRRQVKAWGGRSAKELFPQAKLTAAPEKEFSIEAVDEKMEHDHGANIFNTRFWDPLAREWSPDRFFNGLIEKYFCPFMCEQSFNYVSELRDHILVDHRVSRAKCPYCLKYFDSITALMGHCQSRGSKCQINKADDFGKFLNRLTGGFLSVEEKVRPDYIQNETVNVWNPETREMEKYTPPTVKYLEYTTSKPMDWKEPTKVAAQIGGGSTSGTFNYRNQQARW
ncbi:hypothetical protein P171DRAFT_479096 [Karstenula rhodostoma CBS 690.94]|uniref:C2H2-type domain-containing protein n=1 Tax=Karstenula rhodostoma CBS 690.94 TaxID=1392251 RepID=A0A9P4PX43_9PLEO|nr:hypothetical protein P171DRAFT_479096 [Karstenula rhodostoma CBS 690.94]